MINRVDSFLPLIDYTSKYVIQEAIVLMLFLSSINLHAILQAMSYTFSTYYKFDIHLRILLTRISFTSDDR